MRLSEFAPLGFNSFKDANSPCNDGSGGSNHCETFSKPTCYGSAPSGPRPLLGLADSPQTLVGTPALSACAMGSGYDGPQGMQIDDLPGIEEMEVANAGGEDAAQPANSTGSQWMSLLQELGGDPTDEFVSPMAPQAGVRAQQQNFEAESRRQEDASGRRHAHGLAGGHACMTGMHGAMPTTSPWAGAAGSPHGPQVSSCIPIPEAQMQPYAQARTRSLSGETPKHSPALKQQQQLLQQLQQLWQQKQLHGPCEEPVPGAAPRSWSASMQPDQLTAMDTWPQGAAATRGGGGCSTHAASTFAHGMATNLLATPGQGSGPRSAPHGAAAGARLGAWGGGGGKAQIGGTGHSGSVYAELAAMAAHGNARSPTAARAHAGSGGAPSNCSDPYGLLAKAATTHGGSYFLPHEGPGGGSCASGGSSGGEPAGDARRGTQRHAATTHGAGLYAQTAAVAAAPSLRGVAAPGWGRADLPSRGGSAHAGSLYRTHAESSWTGGRFEAGSGPQLERRSSGSGATALGRLRSINEVRVDPCGHMAAQDRRHLGCACAHRPTYTHTCTHAQLCAPLWKPFFCEMLK